MMNSSRIDAERKAVMEGIEDLLTAHFNEDVEATDEKGKFSITFRVTFDRSAAPTMLKVTSRIAKTQALMRENENPPRSADTVRVEIKREEPQAAVQWLTERELSKHLQISMRHISNLRKAGLPFIQLGSSVRYDMAEVEAYLRGNRRLSSHVERKRRQAKMRAG